MNEYEKQLSHIGTTPAGEWLTATSLVSAKRADDDWWKNYPSGARFRVKDACRALINCVDEEGHCLVIFPSDFKNLQRETQADDPSGMTPRQFAAVQSCDICQTIVNEHILDYDLVNHDAELQKLALAAYEALGRLQYALASKE